MSFTRADMAMMDDPIRTVVLSSYPSVRAGLMALLSAGDGLEIVAGSGPLGDMTSLDADVLVVDLASDDRALEAIEEQVSGIPLVLVGGNPALDLPEAGDQPIAYLPANVESGALVAAVRAVHAGLIVVDPEYRAVIGWQAEQRPVLDGETLDILTPREHEVLRLVAAGLPNKTIARELGISEHTAKFHVGSLLAKLGAASRTEAVTIATRRGLLTV